jgi:hypothetical protein
MKANENCLVAQCVGEKSLLYANENPIRQKQSLADEYFKSDYRTMLNLNKFDTRSSKSKLGVDDMPWALPAQTIIGAQGNPLAANSVKLL